MVSARDSIQLPPPDSPVSCRRMFYTECVVRAMSANTPHRGLSPVLEEVGVYRLTVGVADAGEEYGFLVLPYPVEGDKLFTSYSISNQAMHQADIIGSWTLDLLVIHVDFYLEGMDFLPKRFDQGVCG